MNAIGNVAAVLEFELRRALTPARMAWWSVLAAFPVCIVLLIRFADKGRTERELWPIFLFILVPMLISMLGALLWTAPAVSTEIERESWIYIAVRPGGRAALLLGKYLAAVAWVLPAALTGLTLSVMFARTGDDWRIWWAIARITCLAVPAYAAVYLVLGTLFTRRAMIVAVAYTLLFEFLASFAPAIVNKLTVQFRLRPLLFAWAEIDISSNDPDFMMLRDLLGDAPPEHHVAVLCGYITACLVAAVLLVRWREYEGGRDGDG